MYCQKCGGKLESYASNCAFCGTPVEKYDTKINYVKEEKNNGQKYMSAWKWIGFYLLPAIPLVGSIIQIVLIFKWAFSSNNHDLSLKGYARAQLIVVAIALFFSAILIVCFLPYIMEALEEFQAK